MITSRTTGNALPVVFVFPVVGPMLRSRAGAGSLGIADRISAPAPRMARIREVAVLNLDGRERQAAIVPAAAEVEPMALPPAE